MSIQVILRLPGPADTLLIGHRAIFRHPRDLSVQLPEDAVRRLLSARGADWSNLAALRQFWQPWQYDPLRTNVNTRDLVDRVATLTANGTLQAYIANYRAVDRDRFSAEAQRAIEQILPQLFATPITIGAQSAKPNVGIPADVERLTQVIRRAADHLSPAFRQIYVRRLDKVTLTTFLAALTAWVDQREDAIGLIFDSLLLGSGLVYVPSRKAEAARNLYRTLEILEKDTVTTRNIEEAAWWFAEALSELGPSTLLNVVLRGTRPTPACTVREDDGYKPPPPVAKPPERYLARSTRTSSPPASPPPPQPPSPPAGASPPSGATKPVGPLGGKPKGRRTPVRRGDNQRSDELENASADTLAAAGFDVEQNPPAKPNGKKPDYKINGEYFDNIAPGPKTKAANIVDRAASKVAVDQADRVVINMTDNNLSPADLQKEFKTAFDTPDSSVQDLKEAIIIGKDGSITHLVPPFDQPL
ncbi:MAG TPA: hypothetical protein VFQ27_09285 [Xanthobacteraceae bacterium]|nr:hypothetical protein [Xanthobacteraceae bacterium]